MANLSTSPSSKPKLANDNHLARPVRLQVAAGAQLLADAVASFIEPTSRRGGTRKAEFSFAKAYSSIGSAVPSQNRLAVFQEMAKALAEAIKEAEALKISGAEEESAASPGTGDAHAENDAFMTDMRSQERALRMQDIAAKRLLSSAEMRERLGVTSQALSAAVRAKRMFVLAGPSGENFYPAFFANEKYDRSVLGKVSKALEGLSGGSKWNFFMTPKISLGNKTPLEALAKGKIDQVLVAAAGFLEA